MDFGADASIFFGPTVDALEVPIYSTGKETPGL